MGDSQRSKVFHFDNDDPDMQEAYRSARATFRYFWREVSWEHRRIIPALDLACVKAPFSDAERPGARPNSTKVEQMWVSDVTFDGKYISGTLINSPNELRTYQEGDAVRLKLDQITDWMYVIGGEVYGAYTVNQMRSAMSRQERKEHDSAWGLNFGDPAKIKLVPESDDDDESPESAEHKMSEAMAESLKENLAERPSLLVDTDENGMTLLHQLCLAGSEATVKVLLDAGADPTVVTKRGLTPLQLAQVLGWKRVIGLLKTGEVSPSASPKKADTPKRELAKRPTTLALAECALCGAEVRGLSASSTGTVLCKDCSKPQKAKSRRTKPQAPVDVTRWVVIGILFAFFLLSVYAVMSLWSAISNAVRQQGQQNAPPALFDRNVQPQPNGPNFGNPPNFQPPGFQPNPANTNPPFVPPNAVPSDDGSESEATPAPNNQNTPGRRLPSARRKRSTIPPNLQPVQPNLGQNPAGIGRVPIVGRSVPNARKTEMFGGTGGADFHLDLGNELMVGLDWRMGEWAGTKALGQMMPIGQIHNDKSPIFERTLAPDGYAVGAINVSGGKYVSHLQFIYMKIQPDGSLDSSDMQDGDWIGGEPSDDVKTISGNGKRVIGIYGKRGLVVDAIGLLMAP